jgi:hypothetical protein
MLLSLRPETRNDMWQVKIKVYIRDKMNGWLRRCRKFNPTR